MQMKENDELWIARMKSAPSEYILFSGEPRYASVAADVGDLRRRKSGSPIVWLCARDVHQYTTLRLRKGQKRRLTGRIHFPLAPRRQRATGERR